MPQVQCLVRGRPGWEREGPAVSLDTDGVRLFAGLLTRHLARGGVGLLATHVALDLPDAVTLDLSPWRAGGVSPAVRHAGAAGFDEAFLG